MYTHRVSFDFCNFCTAFRIQTWSTFFLRDFSNLNAVDVMHMNLATYFCNPCHFFYLIIHAVHSSFSCLHWYSFPYITFKLRTYIRRACFFTVSSRCHLHANCFWRAERIIGALAFHSIQFTCTPFTQFEFSMIDSIMTFADKSRDLIRHKNGDLEKYQHVQQAKLGRLCELWNSMRYRQIYYDVVCYVFCRCALWRLYYLYSNKIALYGRDRLLALCPTWLVCSILLL